MKYITAGLMAITLIAGCTDDTTETVTTHLQPETLVKTVHGKFLAACQSEELLHELIAHSVKKEKTKFEAMFNNIDCMPIPKEEIYKILAVHGTLVEFTNAKNSSPKGLWAVEEAFEAQ